MSYVASRLADVTVLITKGTTPTTLGLEFAEKGVPFLRAQNLQDGRVDAGIDPLYISLQTHKVLARSRVFPKDILLSIAGTIGRAALVDEGLPEMNCNQAVAIIRPNGEVDPKYLLHWLNSSAAVDQMRRSEVTATISNLSLGQIGNMSVILPPLGEQRRIAAILDQANDLRRKRRDALSKLNELPGCVLVQMCGEPTRNPMNWPVNRLGDVCSSVSDGPHVSPEYVENGVPFLSTRNIRPDGVLWTDLKFISEADARIQWKKVRPVKGDVLYTKGGTTGIARVVDFDLDFAVWVHVAVLKLQKNKVEPVWLQEMLNSFYCYRQSQRLTKGIVNRDLGLRRMVDITFPLPPIDLQRKIAARVIEIERLKAYHRAHLTKLDALFASLQHRALQGGL